MPADRPPPRLLLLALLGPLLGSCAPERALPAGTETDLRAALAAYDSAWAAKDSAAVERILAADYLYFTSTGGLSDRAETLRLLADTGYVLTLSRRTDVAVALSGAVARVTSRWVGAGRYRSEVIRDDQTCGLTWLWRDGRWTLFTEHCANRPVRPAGPSG